MLELKNITAGYGKKMVLSDVSVKLNDNTITVVMGPNGAGKSTLLKTAYGLIKTSSGDILLDDKKIVPTPQKLVEAGIFMVPQGKRVFRKMTVMENLELATHFWKDRTIFPERLEEVLAHFPDLRERLDDLAGNLSGGQQQMVALARGLLNKPKMVFMDEPSIGLSPKLINDTFHKIKEIKDGLGTAFVIVEHNLKTLLPLTDWAYILDQGKVIYDGKSEGKTLEKMVSAVFK
ncbi:MAG: ABC transporter ATP-binding protein [Alphaproteobacteria bacterium]|nr:ABC transporter ATP-binding protein [Alphaproteobacteria bacterium]